MRAGVGEAEHGRRSDGSSSADRVLVGVRDRDPEARFEVGREAEVEREVDGCAPALGGDASARFCSFEARVRRALGDRPCLPSAPPSTRCAALAEGGAERRVGVDARSSCAVGSARDRLEDLDMLSKGNGAFHWNSKS